MQQQAEKDEAVQELTASLSRALELLAAVKDVTMITLLRGVVERMLETLSSCSRFVISYVEWGFWGESVCMPRFINLTLA